MNKSRIIAIIRDAAADSISYGSPRARRMHTGVANLTQARKRPAPSVYVPLPPSLGRTVPVERLDDSLLGRIVFGRAGTDVSRRICSGPDKRGGKGIREHANGQLDFVWLLARAMHSMWARSACGEPDRLT